MGLQLLDPKVGQRQSLGVEAGEVDWGQIPWGNHIRPWHLGFILVTGKKPKDVKQRHTMIRFMTWLS